MFRFILLILLMFLSTALCVCQYEFENMSQIDSVVIYSEISTTSKLTFIESCNSAITIAKNDIRSDEIKILIVGGVGSRIITTDKFYQEKYSFKYDDFGSVSPPHECLKNYNFEIFNFLNANYPGRWYKEIRKDSYALKQWKKWFRKNH